MVVGKGMLGVSTVGAMLAGIIWIYVVVGRYDVVDCKAQSRPLLYLYMELECISHET